jgi:hypothetical protein
VISFQFVALVPGNDAKDMLLGQIWGESQPTLHNSISIKQKHNKACIVLANFPHEEHLHALASAYSSLDCREAECRNMPL